MQCYTNRASNVAVRDGNLVITARIEDYNGKKYTSGRINTKNSAAWKYGRFEARAKLPEGQYVWPALWMMPRDSVYGSWAASGEIDIMENRGGQNNEHSSTLHFGAGWPNNIYEGSGSRYENFDLTKDYHVYAVEWTPTEMKFFIDGNNYYTISLQRSFNNGGRAPYTKNGQPFDQYFFFIINFAVGGGFFGANANSLTVDMARNWPNPNFYVDYVRAYQLKDTVNNNPTPAPIPTPTSIASSSSSSSGAAGNTNNGGCSVGACGGASCCNDQNNGQQCYNPTQYSCPTDLFSNKNQLCPAGFGSCKGACYDPNNLKCVNGNLQPGKETNSPTPATKSPTTSTTKATTSSSSTKTPTTSSSSATPPTSSSSSCPSGQVNCADATFGNVCYASTGPFDCVNGSDNKPHLCPKGTAACGQATCYPPAKYNCVNGWLTAK